MKLEKLNPSVKAFTVLLSVILLSFQYIIELNVGVFLTSIFLLVFFSDAKIKRIVIILIPAFIAAFTHRKKLTKKEIAQIQAMIDAARKE